MFCDYSGDILNLHMFSLLLSTVKSKWNNIKLIEYDIFDKILLKKMSNQKYLATIVPI